MALSVYTYRRNVASLTNRLISAGVTPAGVVQDGEIGVEYDHVLTPDELAGLNQSMEDAGYEFVRAAERVTARTAELSKDTRAFVYSRYGPEHQQSLAVLFFDAQITGKVNRAAYVGQVLGWIDAVFAYYYTKRDELVAAPDDAALAAITWTFDAFVAADPLVTIEQARSIPD